MTKINNWTDICLSFSDVEIYQECVNQCCLNFRVIRSVNRDFEVWPEQSSQIIISVFMAVWFSLSCTSLIFDFILYNHFITIYCALQSQFSTKMVFVLRKD